MSKRDFEPLRDSLPSLGVGPIRVCMLAYSFYESDGRVMRYAEALAAAGAEVEAIALRREGQAAEETIHGVRVLRIQNREKNERGKLSYLARILAFFFRSLFVVGRRSLAKRYDVVHVHSVPDFEVFAAVVPKLQGAKLILDIHDIVPEFYAAKFKVSEASLVFRALQLVERLSAAFADHVIIANDLWREKLTARSAPTEKCSAFINYPDLTVFDPALRRRGDDGRFVMLYPGTLNWHQGLDIAIKAFAIARAEAPGMEFHIYGEGSARPELQALVDDLQLGGGVFLRPPRPLREIAAIMADADLGVVPKRNDAFGGDAFSTKIMEFMALGVPVVVSATRIDRHYFDDSLLRFFPAGDEQALAQAMLEAYRDRAGGVARSRRARSYVEANCWDIKKYDYLAIVKGLLDGRR